MEKMILGTEGQGRCVASVMKPLNITFVLFALLCFCVSSWSACVTEYWCGSSVGELCFRSPLPNCGWPSSDGVCFDNGMGCLCNAYINNCASSVPTGTGKFHAGVTGACGGTRGCYADQTSSCQYTQLCDSQEEADSVSCAINPDAEGCTDACTAYKNDCESAGGVFQGQVVDDSVCVSSCDICNTQEALENKDFWMKACCAGGMTPSWKCLNNFAEGMYNSQIYGGCNTANWETNKICSDYLSSSSAQIESSVSGQSSSSEISEYCQLFPTDLVCKCEFNPDSPDCVYLSSSSGGEGSSGSGEGSSGSGEGSSGSGGGIGGGDSSGSGGGIGGGGDWEYDYRDSLHRVINATTRTANNTGEIAINTGIIKSILQQAKCLFIDCTDYGAIKDALDSNVNIPSGDTAGVLDSMARLNNLDSLGGYIDGLNWASYGDSIDGALNELGNGVDGLFTDSGLYGSMNDYRDMIEDKFPTAQWSYTSSCPAALNSTISFNFPAPIGTISAGRSLGGYFCGPLPPFDITLGNMIRAVIRLALTIAMAIGIFKAATGFKNE